MILQPTDLSDKLSAAIDAAYEKEDQSITYVRSKAIGAGSIGDKCLRKIFYKFRWFKTNVPIEGRILRLFDRGHREEPALWKHFDKLGATIYEFQDEEKKKQYKMKFCDDHGTGFVDVFIAGISQWLLGTEQDELILGEAKTYNKAQFNDLKKKGFREKKPEHYAQMVLYMQHFDVKHGLYIAVCKDDDRLHFEYIPRDDQYADDMKMRAESVVYSDVLPHKYSDNPTFFECKFCDFKPVCHQGVMPEVNCRTCAYAKTEAGMVWRCLHPRVKCDALSPEMQVNGANCSAHAFHPYFIDNPLLRYQSEKNIDSHFAYQVGDTEVILYNGMMPPDEEVDYFRDSHDGIPCDSKSLYATAIEINDGAG